MKRPPTDLELLQKIYELYYATFISFAREKPNRSSKIYVPIDIEVIAKHFSVDPDIIFGRLYYHFEKKYGFKQEDGSSVRFFSLGSCSDKYIVQFPLLASVMATLREERNKHIVATWLSVIAIIISVASLVASFILR
jgi:hypothetical protein